jgi:hypothetical protein
MLVLFLWNWMLIEGGNSSWGLSGLSRRRFLRRCFFAGLIFCHEEKNNNNDENLLPTTCTTAYFLLFCFSIKMSAF